ncbi:MAG TPA: class I SAM-dependent methyltransferase [Cyclobacteriaceae bacterium]|nr:class I SAM-dependent methyltransferase [Cyclobacteriaceae bacterium]
MCLTTAHTDTALADRLFQSTINTLELYSVYIGKKLGLYRVLRDPVTCIELSLKTGIAVRYSREWLEQQAVAGFIVADGERDAYLRKYHIPEEHIGVLVDDANPSHVAPFAQMLVGIARALPDVLLAYKAGTGVAYEKYGLDFRQGQGGINKPAFSHDLIASWLPAVPDLQQRLVSGDDVRILDVGCGVGWSSIALAKAYPNAKVTGIDMDAGSIQEASAHATRERVDVRFLHDDASYATFNNPFDLVLILETLHDLSRPTAVLENLRRALKDDGCVIIGDERVAESFFSPGDDLERMMYGWSVTHCLPVSMSEHPTEAIGTVIRPAKVMEVAARAGFSKIEVLPIENVLFRFYRLTS